MSRPALEVADIFRRYGPAYQLAHHGSLSHQQLRVMRMIQVCRTDALGGHVDQCDQCGHVRISYNSCRNRHCPKCQSLAKEQWLADRQADLLPVDTSTSSSASPHSLPPWHIKTRASSTDSCFNPWRKRCAR